MELAALLTAIASLTFLQMSLVSGHGRLMDPPARNSMWRFGFNNPVNYRDNELFCGGIKVTKTRSFKCGICGDEYGDPKPQYAAGGKFARGIIGRKYKTGQEIPVEVQLTANHWGRFEMRLCPNNDPKIEASQSCFDKYPLYLAGTKDEMKFEIPTTHHKWGIFRYNVRLPPGLTCSQCVLQWTYFTGRTWGRCPNGTEAIGCDGLLAFRNCADIAILGGSQGGNSLKPDLTVTYPGFQPAYTFIEVSENQSQGASGIPQMPQLPLKPMTEDLYSVNEIDSDVLPEAVIKGPSSGDEKKPEMSQDRDPLPKLRHPVRDTCDAVGEMAAKPGAESFCQAECILYPYPCHEEEEKRCRCYKADNSSKLYANYFELSSTNVLDYDLYLNTQ